MADKHTERQVAAARANFEEGVAGVVRGLRDMANQVEREGKIREEPNYVGTPGAAVVQAVVNAVTWGVANLNLDSIIGRANRYDEAVHEADRAAQEEQP